jgi:hypothetical protein
MPSPCRCAASAISLPVFQVLSKSHQQLEGVLSKLSFLAMAFVVMWVQYGHSQQRQATTSIPLPYTDPFQYCSGVRNADSSEGGIRDSRYAGPATPGSITKAMKDEKVWWRCMDAKVYACALGASGRGCQKWTTRKTASPSIRQFCEAHPNSGVVPNSDNDTIFSWKCKAATPVLDQKSPPPRLDKRGYMRDSWQQILPQ